MAFNFAEIMADRQRRSRFLVFIMVVASLLGLGFFWLTAPKDVQPGFKANIVCRDCGHKETIRLRSIKDVRCPKCKSRNLGFAWKCRGCDFEFPFIKPEFKTDDKRNDSWELVEKVYVCPNCGQRDVFAIPVKKE